MDFFYIHCDHQISKHLVTCFSKIEKEIKLLLDKHPETPEWLDCQTTCYHTLHHEIEQEINSTAYMLCVLTASIISLQPKSLVLLVNMLELNCLWEDDQHHIKIIKLGNNKKTKGRLIMGFGPSAPGKTFGAKTIVSMFSESIEDFPDSCFSIDGGIYREQSVVYHRIVDTFTDHSVMGLNNLVLSKVSLKTICKDYGTLFRARIVKKRIIKFLQLQTVPLSLYVPETLGSCGYGPIVCRSKIEPYQQITKDKEWIGLLIYQYRNAIECTLAGTKYACRGCVESGKERQNKRV